MDKESMIEFAQSIMEKSLSQEHATRELESNGLTDVKVSYCNGQWTGSAKYNGEEINF